MITSFDWLLIMLRLVNPAPKLWAIALLFGVIDYCAKSFLRRLPLKLMLLWSERILSLFYCLYLCGFHHASSAPGNAFLKIFPDTLFWTLAISNPGNGIFLFIIGVALLMLIVLTAKEIDNRVWRICFMQLSSALGILFAADITSVIIYLELLALLSTYVIMRYCEHESSEYSVLYFLIQLIGSLLMITSVIWYGMQYSNWHDVAHWFAAETWYGNLCCEVFLLGLLIKIGMPPLLQYLINTYSELSLPSQISTLVSIKSAVFILIDIFIGHKLLLYAGIIILLYVGLKTIFESRPVWLAIYLSFLHLGINFCYLAYADKSCTVAIMLDIGNVAMSLIGLLILIRVAICIDLRIKSSVSNLFLLLRCWQGRLLLLLMYANLYFIVVIASIPGRLSYISAMSLGSFSHILMPYIADMGHLLVLAVCLKFLLGSVNFWRQSPKALLPDKILPNTGGVILWYSYGLLSLLYCLWNAAVVFAGQSLNLPAINMTLGMIDIDGCMSVAFFTSVIVIMLYKFSDMNSKPFSVKLMLNEYAAKLRRIMNITLMIKQQTGHIAQEVVARCSNFSAHFRDNIVGATLTDDTDDVIYTPSFALCCLFTMLICLLLTVLLVAGFLPII